MLFVVVLLIVMLVMDFNMFLFSLLILLLVGVMVLLDFGSTHYPARGGGSNNGAYCGAFFVNAGHTASVAHWSFGTAL